MRMLCAAGAILAASVAAIIWTLGGITAAAYFAVFVLATLPGLPFGFHLFGRRHAAGWIAGMLLGYVVTALVCWATVFVGHASNLTVAGGWGVVTMAAWVSTWRRRTDGLRPLVSLAPWTVRDTAALLLVLLLVPVLTGPAFARLGSRDAQGNRLFHAYFTADFVWHTALVAEMKKHAQPPRNPYLASQPLHYYWTYFLVPAAAGPLTGADVELSLKMNAVGTALLFVSAVYLTAWAALPGYSLTIAAALLLTIVAASAEGLAAIIYVMRSGQSLAAVRDLNVDAMSRGFGGLRIDDLPRAMWYAPQHAIAYSLGLIALPVAIAAGVRARPLAIVLAGMALGGSVMLNPFVGAVFCAIYSVVVLDDAVRSRTRACEALRHTLAVLPVALALAWVSLNQIADGARNALRFGLPASAAESAVLSFLLSFGPILVLIVAGLWPQREIPFRTIVAAFAGVLLSVLVMHLVVISVDLFWIGFRTGHLLFVFAPALVARGLIRLSTRGRSTAVVVATIVFLIGAPTTAIDAFNAQDVENDRVGPGFHWTVKQTRAEQDGLAWVRDHTPLDAIVQMEPVVRGRETWSLIPSWGERRMAGGEPISLMHVPAYDVISVQVQRLYESADPSAAWLAAKQLRIDFLYVGAAERRESPNVAKFDDDAKLFLPVFKNTEVAIYAVR